MIGDFNNPLSTKYRKNRRAKRKYLIQTIIPYTQGTSIYKVFHPITAEHIFLSTHGKFSRVYHMLNHKTINLKGLILCKTCPFTTWSKLEVNNKRKCRKLINICKFIETPLNI